MKVRVNSLYRYSPCAFDRFVSPVRNVETNDIVRVINKYGCPKANTMGMCYIEHLGGEFIQMVCCGSLVSLTAEEKKHVKRARRDFVFRGSKVRHVPSTRYNLDIVRDGSPGRIYNLYAEVL